MILLGNDTGRGLVLFMLLGLNGFYVWSSKIGTESGEGRHADCETEQEGAAGMGQEARD